MTDDPTTPDLDAAAADAPTPADTEADLRRWLGELVDDTTTDPEAWATIQRHIAAAPPVGSGMARSPGRSQPRRAIALAAAIALVIATAIVLGRDHGFGKVDTVDDTSTTDHDVTPTTDGKDTATSTTGSASSTTLPPGSPGPADAEGAAAGSGEAVAPGTGSPGAAAPADGAHLPPPGTTPANAAPRAQLPTAVSVTTADYTLEAAFGEDDTMGYIVEHFRVDGLGNVMEIDWRPNDVPPSDGTCLSVTIEWFNSGPLAPHSFAMGLTGPAIATMDVVMTDGSRVRAEIGTGPPGHDLRGWLAEIPSTVDHVEGFDAGGDLVVTAPWNPRTASPVGC